MASAAIVVVVVAAPIEIQDALRRVVVDQPNVRLEGRVPHEILHKPLHRYRFLRRRLDHRYSHWVLYVFVLIGNGIVSIAAADAASFVIRSCSIGVGQPLFSSSLVFFYDGYGFRNDFLRRFRGCYCCCWFFEYCSFRCLSDDSLGRQLLGPFCFGRRFVVVVVVVVYGYYRKNDAGFAG